MSDASNRLKTIGTALLLALFGIGVSLLIIVVLIQLFPQLEPGGQRVVFTLYDGDSFRHQPGLVRPPAENAVLEDVRRFDDSDGFRLPAMVAEDYTIIAIGDSFTDGGERPWVDVLATELDTPVRNLGWSGIGPVEYARIAEQFATGDHDWIVIGYFEGNDLSNIKTSWERAQANGGVYQLDLSRTIGAPITDVRTLEDYADIRLSDDDWYLYPLMHPREGADAYPLAYISDYVWWLNGDAETYRQSRNIAELNTALDDVMTAAGDACVALMYIPTKGHIYFPHAAPDGNRVFVLQNALTLRLGDDGWLTFDGPGNVDYDTLYARFDNQRDVVRDVAVANGVHFIDLVPAFQDGVVGDTVTYFTYDSHWNVNGHQLAGEVVADYLRRTPCQPLP